MVIISKRSHKRYPSARMIHNLYLQVGNQETKKKKNPKKSSLKRKRVLCCVRGLGQERALFEAQIWIPLKTPKRPNFPHELTLPSPPTPPTTLLITATLTGPCVYKLQRREIRKERDRETVSRQRNC